MRKKDTPHPRNLQVRISKCCGTQTTSIPPCFRDPELVICRTCNSFCEAEWQPAYYEVSKGTWRKADYTINNKLAIK